MNPALMSSKSTEWETPRKLYDRLHARYCFELDAAASPRNALCDNYYSEAKRDAFASVWTGRIWCNPPYGRVIGSWVDHVLDVAMPIHEAELVVMLVPARTDTRWAQRLLHDGRTRVHFLPGRLKFTIGGVEQDPAPFPSMIAFIGREW